MHSESNGTARFYALLTALVCAVAVFRGALIESPWVDWASTQWLFNYQEGWVKRGLAGEILRLGGVPVTVPVIAAIHYFVALLATAALACVFYRPLRRPEAAAGTWLFVFLAVTNPGTIQHLSYDFGRLDTLCLLLAIGCLWAVERMRGPLLGAFVTFAMGTSILIHEASFFMFPPLIFAYWAVRDQLRADGRIRAIALLALIVTTYLVSSFGLRDVSRLEADYQVLARQHGDWVTLTSLDVLYKGTLRENLVRAVEKGMNWKRFGHHVLFFSIVLVPLVVWGRKILAQIRAMPRSGGALLLIASAFAPLALYFLGHDHFRWWSISLINLCLALALLAHTDPKVGQIIAATTAGNRRAAAFVGAFWLLVGPLGSTESVAVSPEMRRVVKQLPALLGK